MPTHDAASDLKVMSFVYVHLNTAPREQRMLPFEAKTGGAGKVLFLQREPSSSASVVCTNLRRQNCQRHAASRRKRSWFSHCCGDMYKPNSQRAYTGAFLLFSSSCDGFCNLRLFQRSLMEPGGPLSCLGFLLKCGVSLA